MQELKKIDLYDIALEIGKSINHLPLTYQTFGPQLGTAPVVVVNHALTGNSNVAGENGWWRNLIGPDKTIDTGYFTIVAFNIPGNGYDGNVDNLISNYTDFTIRDVAQIFWQGLSYLNIGKVHSVIGGSLGGAIAWEMAVLKPEKIDHIIPIATDWKATDWMIGNLLIQDQILTNSDDPISDARLHAMLLYRTPQSVNNRFLRNRQDNQSLYDIENWLVHHGNALKDRFTLSAYKLMNHLLKTNDITRNRTGLIETLKTVRGNIHIVAVDTDYFFTADECRDSFEVLRHIYNNVGYHEIHSIHGHDAFLIEQDQLNKILQSIFTIKKQYNEST